MTQPARYVWMDEMVDNEMDELVDDVAEELMDDEIDRLVYG